MSCIFSTSCQYSFVPVSSLNMSNSLITVLLIFNWNVSTFSFNERVRNDTFLWRCPPPPPNGNVMNSEMVVSYAVWTPVWKVLSPIIQSYRKFSIESLILEFDHGVKKCILQNAWLNCILNSKLPNTFSF